jgi:hypothetical protein
MDNDRCHRCGRMCAFLVFLGLFSGAARVDAQSYALGTTTLLEGPAIRPTYSHVTSMSLALTTSCSTAA